jgi:hypothetical protein
VSKAGCRRGLFEPRRIFFNSTLFDENYLFRYCAPAGPMLVFPNNRSSTTHRNMKPRPFPLFRFSFRFHFLFTLALLTSIAWGQGVGTLGGTYQRFGRISINTHGARIPRQLLHYINTEGELLLIKNRALGFDSPKDFFYKIDFFPDRATYARFMQSRGQSSSALGVTFFPNIVQLTNGDNYENPTMPLQIACYFNHEEPWMTVPVLLHEMTHAVHGSNYGAMPLWLQEGLPNWFSHRKHHLGVNAKIDILNSYQRHMKLVQEMDERTFLLFIASTQYGDWEKVIGNVGVGYFLAETLVDFFLGNPRFQPFFRGAIAKAKSTSRKQFVRSITCAAEIEVNWPGGIVQLLTGWKKWYIVQSKPRRSDELEPFLVANEKRFHELVRAVRGKRVVTDADRYAFVSQWLAYKRLEMDDLSKKLVESYHRGENILLRSRQWHVQQFATKDHASRLNITQTRRNVLRKTQPSVKDPLYKRSLPYQSLAYYLNLDPAQGIHARPPYLGSTGLPPQNFRWTGLDAWQANMIFTNLFTAHIGQPEGLPTPKLKSNAQGPFTQALRKNSMNAAVALKAVGGSLQRDPLTGRVTVLKLARTAIDNDDLEHLALLFQTRELDLSDTDITDSAWPHLVGWASLRVLNLRRTRISADTVKGLKRYSPGLEIQ